MEKLFRKPFLFVRGKWRWVRGRCPVCNRNLHATFANYVAGHPNCPACKDQPNTDARVCGTNTRPRPLRRPPTLQELESEYRHEESNVRAIESCCL